MIGKSPTEFALTEAQVARLSAWRAWWEEGEDRFRHWETRDRDEEAVREFSALLRESRFESGKDLTIDALDRLCGLARRLAPNPNLDRRLYTGTGEPKGFSRLLRDLLFGRSPLANRLTALLERKSVGGQTASQLLCAAFPARFPILYAPALAALEITPEQRAEALAQAAASHELPEIHLHDPAQQMLAELVIYEAIKEALGADDYLLVHRILLAGVREPIEAPVFHAPALLREARASYAPAPVSESDLLLVLEEHAQARGFIYPPLTIRNVYVALKTKPFVILSGVSGTGKTRLTHLFAEALTGDTERQYRLLPVRPDWTDSTALLGYLNILAGPEGRYMSAHFLDFLREAARPENAGRAYFVCLDEMNLARVEHYFADVLSALESPQKQIPLQGGSSVRLPPNLFINGSVNVDETTFAFSRKVLDRANTIELSEVDLAAGIGRPRPLPGIAGRPEMGPAQRQALFLDNRVADVAAAQRKLRGIDPGLVERALVVLIALNEALAKSQMHFGYRVRDEALIYLANSYDSRGRGLFDDDPNRNAEIALDFQIVQKVLPRLSGTQEQIESAVRALLARLLPESDQRVQDAASNLRPLEQMAARASFPRSARKLVRLLARLQRDGYVSFYE